MSAGGLSSASGSFGVVNRPRLGTAKERSLVDEDRLTEEMKEALDADTFIVYGKASVEQYDEDNPPQQIRMEAFEDELPSYLDGGMVSRRHKDIPVGDPLESHTLDEPTEVVVADEVLEFEAGDTLETGVRDDELWIVADLRNDSEIARETRLGAMTGDLTGFSVTVFCKEWDETAKGQDVHDIDWHSTTIGGDEHIKNEDSRFGVAEYKALFGEEFPGLSSKQAERATTEILRELPSSMSNDEDSKSFWSRVGDIANQKAKDEEQDGADADQKEAEPPDGEDGEDAEKKEGGPPADVPDGDDEEDEFGEKADASAVLEQVKNELGDEQAEVLEDAMEADEDEEDDSEAEEGELKAEDVAEELKSAGFVTEDELDEKAREVAEAAASDAVEEKMGDVVSGEEFGERVGEKLDERLPEGDIASKGDVEDVMKAAEDVITETLPEAQKAAAEDAADEVAEKMATGSTPDPSGGSAQDEQDYVDQIQDKFGTAGGD